MQVHTHIYIYYIIYILYKYMSHTIDVCLVLLSPIRSLQHLLESEKSSTAAPRQVKGTIKTLGCKTFWTFFEFVYLKRSPHVTVCQ